MEENEVYDDLDGDRNQLLTKVVYTGSRSAWGFFGGMLLLMLMNDTLYFGNIIYPYVAKLAGLGAFVLAIVFDAVYKRLTFEW